MIDEERDLNTTYRIDLHPGGIFLRTFPRVPQPVCDGWYRTDQIPQWMVEAIALLDAAYPSAIPDIGVRIGVRSYWIEPPGTFHTKNEKTP